MLSESQQDGKRESKGKALPRVPDQAVGVPIRPIPDRAVAHTTYARIK